MIRGVLSAHIRQSEDGDFGTGGHARSVELAASYDAGIPLEDIVSAIKHKDGDVLSDGGITGDGDPGYVAEIAQASQNRVAWHRSVCQCFCRDLGLGRNRSIDAFLNRLFICCEGARFLIRFAVESFARRIFRSFKLIVLVLIRV